MPSAANHAPLMLALFGPPGSGKGTQAERLCAEFDLVHLATGDLLRLELRNRTPLGCQADAIIRAGQLVPDELVQAMLKEHLLRAIESGRGVVLDGFPRTVPQMHFLLDLLAAQGRELHAVLNLVIPLERLVERLTGRRVCKNCGRVYHIVAHRPAVDGRCDTCGGELYQRADDTREAIERRMAVYEEQTRPVLALARERDVLIDVPADGTREEVYARLAEHVRQVQHANAARESSR